MEAWIALILYMLILVVRMLALAALSKVSSQPLSPRLQTRLNVYRERGLSFWMQRAIKDWLCFGAWVGVAFYAWIELLPLLKLALLALLVLSLFSVMVLASMLRLLLANWKLPRLLVTVVIYWALPAGPHSLLRVTYWGVVFAASGGLCLAAWYFSGPIFLLLWSLVSLCLAFLCLLGLVFRETGKDEVGVKNLS